MKTVQHPEAITSSSSSPAADSTSDLEQEELLHHLETTILEIKPKQTTYSRGQTTRQRAKEIRQNKKKLSELDEKGRYVSKNPTAPSNSRYRPSHKPLWDGDQLRTKLQSYDRTPFLDLLASFMECAPTPQTVFAWAERYPDRWAKALTDLGRLGGFADKKELEVNMMAQITRMSDSQIEDKLREHAYKLGIPLPKLLELKATVSADPETADLPPQQI